MTAQEKLPGARSEDFAAFGERFKAESELPRPIAERLLRIYGTRAGEVLEIACGDTELLKTFSPLTGAIGAELLYSFRCEMAETLVDCLMRRTMVGLNSASGLDAAEAAARIAQKHLGWDESRSGIELAAYRNYIERFHPRKMFSAVEDRGSIKPGV